MLSISCDCSGIEAPIEALKQMKIEFNHLWSCDNNKDVKESIEANYEPNKFFDNIITRKNSSLKEFKNKVDIYVAGFPCQAFSSLGQKKGFKELEGNIFFQCFKTIKYTKPKVYILENVKNLLHHDNGKTFKTICQFLDSLKNYDYYYKILNTKDFNIPQSRPRLYIVGIMKDQKIKDFSFPNKIKATKTVKDFVDKKFNTSKYRTEPTKYVRKRSPKKVQLSNKILITTPDTWGKINTVKFPCITTSGAIYLINQQRYLQVPELLKLQGFSKKFKQVISDSKMKKQIGNTMSVNVLKVLFKKIFQSTKLQNNK